MLRDFADRLRSWIARGVSGPNIMQIARQQIASGSTITEKTAYKSSPWVYRAIRYKADNLARLPWRIMQGQRGDPKAAEPAKAHPMEAVLERPNTEQDGHELRVQSITLLETLGAVFFVMPDRLPHQYPTTIMASSPINWRRKKDTHGVTVAWELTRNGTIATFAPWEILLVRYVDPDDPEGYLSPLTAARKGINAGVQAETWNESFYTNSAVPRGALSTDRNMDPDMAKRAMSEWQDLYGGPANAHRVALLAGGLKFSTIEASHADMEWLQGQTWNRDLVFVVTGVWPEVFGYGSTTFSNRSEAVRDVWKSTLRPLGEKFDAAMWAGLFWSLDRGRYWLQHDFSSVEELQQDYGNRLEYSERLWKMGVPMRDLNMRFELGLEEYEGWDVSYLPGGVFPTSELLEPAEEDPTEEESTDAQDWLRSIPARLEALACVPSLPLPEVVAEAVEEPPSELEAEQRADKTSRAKGGQRYLRDRRSLEKRAASKLRRHFADLRGAILRKLSSLDDGGRAMFEAMTADLEDLLGEDRRAWTSDMVERAISKADVDRILKQVLDSPSTSDSLKKAMRPIYRDAVRAGGLQVIAEAGTSDEEGTWKPSKEQVKILSDRGQEITRIHETTRKRITGALAEGLAAQENITDLQARVRSSFNATNARALLIARSEVGGAMNDSRQLQMEREGAEYHEWVSSMDGATRDDHRAEDGNRVRVGEEFPVTGLRYPNDPMGDASQVCNCRCRTVAVERA